MIQNNELTAGSLDLMRHVIETYKGQKWVLIPLLQRIQDEFGYIPEQIIPYIAQALGLFPSQIQGVITFYAQLYTQPRGKKVIRVCRGTACHVKGGKNILKLIKERLDVEEGETTEDLEYTLETVACIGVCALAPNITVGNQVYGNMNPKKIEIIFSKRNK